MSQLERVGWGFKYSQVWKPLLIENKSNVIHTSPNIHQNSHHHHSQWLLLDCCHPKFLQEWSHPQDFQGWIPAHPLYFYPALQDPLRQGTHCCCLLGLTLMPLMYYKCLLANYGHTCDQWQVSNGISLPCLNQKSYSSKNINGWGGLQHACTHQFT